MPDTTKNISPTPTHEAAEHNEHAAPQVEKPSAPKTDKPTPAKKTEGTTSTGSRANIPEQMADTLVLLPDSATEAKVEKVPAVLVPSDPKGVPVENYAQSLSTTPWLVGILLLLFVLLSVRYKNNFRFLRAMMSDLVSVRHRNNMFDDTLRETSFLITLDLLCIAEVSIMAMMGVLHFIPKATTMPLAHVLGICLTSIGALYLLQWLAYNLCGYIFSDRESRKLWVRSFAISQGLLGIALFPVTLATIFNPAGIGWLIWVGIGCFGAARILFIYKGFRIFFTQIGSWVLFLYYLCSLEAIPLILTFLGIAAWISA